jgi:large subunit ribosomal protein L18
MMAKGTTYRLGLKRRRIGRTDYRRRTRYLLSGLPRLVIRRTNAHYFVHVVVAREEGDLTVASAHSGELEGDFGWLGHTGSAASGYLTGYLCAKRAMKAGVREAILDAGLTIPEAGSNVFAALKGTLDGGLKVPCDEGILPPMNRIRGEDLSKAAEADDSILRFRKKDLDAASLPAHFDGVVEKMEGDNKEE